MLSSYLKVLHLLAQLHDRLRPEDILRDKVLQRSVKFDRRRRVEDDVHLVDDRLPVLRRQAQPRLGHVAAEGHHLIKGQRRVGAGKAEGSRSEEVL